MPSETHPPFLFGFVSRFLFRRFAQSKCRLFVGTLDQIPLKLFACLHAQQTQFLGASDQIPASLGKLLECRLKTLGSRLEKRIVPFFVSDGSHTPVSGDNLHGFGEGE